MLSSVFPKKSLQCRHKPQLLRICTVRSVCTDLFVIDVSCCLANKFTTSCLSSLILLVYLVCLQTLGLDRSASWREVKAAYKRLALTLHPDKQRGATPDQAAAVAQRFQEVAEAHDVLTNETQRAAYDKVRDYMVRCFNIIVITYQMIQGMLVIIITCP